MANIAPILRVKGRVRQVRDRVVEPMPARDAYVDDNGVTRGPYPAREGYDVKDVTIDTDPGGLITVVFRDQAIEDAGGWMPAVGDSVDVPVRAFDAWQGPETRRYRVNGYSFAGSVWLDENKSADASTPAGSRALREASGS